MKQKILQWIFKNNSEFFQNEVKKGLIQKDLTDLKRAHLTEVFENNKHFFELLLVKDFIGYIPKSVSEPALKIFEEQSEMFEKWILWQSYDINNRALNDTARLPIYKGMMIYLKVLITIARIHKKNKLPPEPKIVTTVEESWVDQALKGVSEFSYGFKNKDDKGSETEEHSVSKA